jgi:aspartyl-tRNA(Asn)/glutamyl-tRNA(Gln) amidotransferase subunit A
MRATSSAQQAVADALDAVERWNAQLACFIEVDGRGVNDAARASDERRRDGRGIGPLDGIPFGVKANIACTGLEWNAGLRARAGIRATEDAWVVHRLRSLGAIPLGATNMAEGAIGATTDNPFFGVCRNPVDPERSAGGSSGGSACAVAAGIVPFALGTDTLGSVRIPAAYCGVAAWKPSRGTIENQGVVPLCSDLDTVGIFARSASQVLRIADTLGLLEQRGQVAMPTVVVLEAMLLRQIDLEVRRGFEMSLERLRDLGYQIRIDRRELPDLGRLRRALLLRCEVEAAAHFASLLESNPSGFSPALRALLEFGYRADSERIALAEEEITASVDRLAATFGDGELLVLPTSPHVACPVGSDGPVDAVDFTAWVNPFGGSAVSIPVRSKVSEPGRLPVGVQVVGPPGHDGSVLALAARLEEAP